MASTYFNHAVLGNSRMLACVSDRGELVRMFWPCIDREQHIDRFAAGVFLKSKGYAVWLHDGRLEHSQEYPPGTNILRTVCIDRDYGYKAVHEDFVLPDGDALIRRFTIENTGSRPMDAGFSVFSSMVSTHADLRCSLFDFDGGALIHYKADCYIAVSADLVPAAFQLGNNAFDCAGRGVMNGWDSIGMTPEGAVQWDIGVIRPGGSARFSLRICISPTLKGAKRFSRELLSRKIEDLQDRTALRWREFLASARHIRTERKEIRDLYDRSVLLFKLMSDERSGGLLASPEIDEDFTRCGRYAYCWGRDAAFITGAMDCCGLHAAVDLFYDWACRAQDEDGSWQQRHQVDGNLGPSWGLQVDETGTLVWGMREHYRATGALPFLERMWPSVEAAADFLAGFADPETALPRPSFDLWEERFGEHAYSTSAVCAGLFAAADIARLLGKAPQKAIGWEKAAAGFREAMVRYFRKETPERFIRSVRVKLNPWGAEPGGSTVMIPVNPMGYRRDVTPEDWTADISLLGLCIPFGTFDVRDPAVEKTADLLERTLAAEGVGGRKRYENDRYIGGNPWVIATLWAALYHIARGETGRAKEYFEWAVQCRTGLNFLPEQVDRQNGRPAWVIPLTWSHAMFVLVLFGLEGAGVVL